MSSCPLVVDLDGTLLKSDLAVESLAHYLKARPAAALSLFTMAGSGKAGMKARLAEDYQPNLDLMPWNREFLAWLKDQKQQGRHLILATGSNQKLANEVAEHVGLFDEVMASSSGHNLTGTRKRDALLERFGEQGFDYAGNSKVDLPVWQAARDAIVVNANPRTIKAAEASANVVHVFDAMAPELATVSKAMRIYQWSKNLLIFFPLLAIHPLLSVSTFFTTCMAFLAWGLCASSVYLLNDLLDLEDDRKHRIKRYRPLAAGTLSVGTALFLMPLLLLVSIAIGATINPWFCGVLVLYFILTLLYSFHLKQIPMLDVVILAALYTSRIIGGAAAITVAPSMWLLAFSMFLFLSLAIVKRCAELYARRSEGVWKKKIRGYHSTDLQLLVMMGSASGYMSVLVLALYASSDKVTTLYEEPRLIWLLCPVLLYWISRVWLLTHRGHMNQDPIVFAARDRSSLISCLIMGVIYLLAI